MDQINCLSKTPYYTMTDAWSQDKFFGTRISATRNGFSTLGQRTRPVCAVAHISDKGLNLSAQGLFKSKGWRGGRI
jgi:hypothetical protein